MYDSDWQMSRHEDSEPEDTRRMGSGGIEHDYDSVDWTEPTDAARASAAVKAAALQQLGPKPPPAAALMHPSPPFDPHNAQMSTQATSYEIRAMQVEANRRKREEQKERSLEQMLLRAFAWGPGFAPGPGLMYLCRCF